MIQYEGNHQIFICIFFILGDYFLDFVESININLVKICYEHLCMSHEQLVFLISKMTKAPRHFTQTPTLSYITLINLDK